MTELRTPRLLLRPARADDLEPLHAILSDERSMLYWWEPPHPDLEHTREWLQAMMTTCNEREDFVITLNGSVIGKLGASCLPDVGFILGSEHWSRGYASEAMTAFLAHVFGRPDVSFLTADVDPRNQSSLRLLAGHGFVETGRASGTWNTHIGLCDSIYLRLEENAWRALRQG